MNAATMRTENERLKLLLTEAQAALSEHQAALATSEEALRRLDVTHGDLRRGSSVLVREAAAGSISFAARRHGDCALRPSRGAGEGGGGHPGPLARWIG